MLDLERLSSARLESAPYRWAAIDRLFAADDAARLAATFPADHFLRRSMYDGEKDHDYEMRCVTRKGGTAVFRAEGLSAPWQTLARELVSRGYRQAMATLTGLDLSAAPLEITAYRYPPGGRLGAHPDTRDKLVTHILYFNPVWHVDDGGCLAILRSADDADVAAVVPPVVGNSAVLVRSDDSWHAVSRVVEHVRLPRCSLTVTFYRPGSRSEAWPSRPRRMLGDVPARLWKRVTRGAGE